MGVRCSVLADVATDVEVVARELGLKDEMRVADCAEVSSLRGVGAAAIKRT